MATSTIWYGRQHQGKNTLGVFMNEISKNFNLSQVYTNHSVSVTGVTVLTRQNFSASEIISITGHKSVQSLTRYQKTQAKQKITMGNVMHQSMTREEDLIVVPGRKKLENVRQAPALQYEIPQKSATTAIVPFKTNMEEQKENVNDVVVPFEADFNEQEVPDFDLLEMLKEYDEPKKTERPPTTAMMNNQVLNNVPKSLFHNCNIQNVTFNMPK